MSLYDIEKFDPQPDPDLVCCICQCVLYKAVESPCRHVFCQGCIERWLSKRHTCPTCRKKTRKLDLKPVLPLVQNMLNRLLMKCDFYNNGCVQKIMLEHYERHIKDCGYEMKTCRFIKCGQKILKMDLEHHEDVTCEHRESVCEGECGLMIALSDKPNHNCVSALKLHIEEKNRMVDTLKAKLQELNHLSQTLNDQLVQLRQQLDENRPIYFSPLLLSSSSESVVSGIVDDSLRDVSMDIDSSLSNGTLSNNMDTVSTVDINDRDDGNEPTDVVQQVERTVVTSLIDLSSRLERVRNQMRSVLDRGVMDDDNDLNDDVRIPSDALNAIVNNRPNSSASGHNDRWDVTSTIDGNNSGVNSSTTTINIFDLSRNQTSSEHNHSDHQDITEYSPASFYSNSELSEGESDTNIANENQNEPAISNDIDHQTCTDSLEEIMRNERARSTQSWVQSVICSPVHSIETQPPLSPSESESSYSSIPSMSSAQSGSSTVNQDIAHSFHHSPTNYLRNEEISPRSIFSSTNSTSSNENISQRKDSHNEETTVNDDNLTVRNSSRTTSTSNSSDCGTLRGSTAYGHSDRESITSHKSSCTHERADRNSSIDQYSIDSSNTNDSIGSSNSESSKTSLKIHYQRNMSDNEKNVSLKKQKSSPLNPVSEQFCLNTAVTNSSHEQSNEATYNEENQNCSDSHNSTHCVLGNNSRSELDSSDTSSETSDHSENENSRRTWKYETKTPLQRYSETGTKSKPSSTISYDQANEDELKRNKQNCSILPVCASISGQSNKSNTDSYCIKTRRSKARSFKSSPERLNNTVDRKMITFQSYMNANSPCRTDNKDIKSDIDIGVSELGHVDDQDFDDTLRKTVDNRKRKSDKFHGITATIKRSRHGDTTSTGSSSGYYSQKSKQSSPRLDSTQNNWILRPSAASSSNTQSRDKSTQSLNVKIDLSLINYTGDILTQPVVTQAIPTSGSTLVHSSSTISPQNSSVSGALKHTRSSFIRNNETTLSTPARQQCAHQRKLRDTQSSDMTSHREFPNVWCDDSDSASDKTWKPEAGAEDTDVSVSEEDDTEISEPEYEVKVPKSTYDLINEYASDETDESWTHGLDSDD